MLFGAALPPAPSSHRAVTGGDATHTRGRPPPPNPGPLLLVVWLLCGMLGASLTIHLTHVVALPACILAGDAIGALHARVATATAPVERKPKGSAKTDRRPARSAEKPAEAIEGAAPIRCLAIGLAVAATLVMGRHVGWMLSSVLSTPTLKVPGLTDDGEPTFLDDRREAYEWIRANVPKKAVVAAWWDHGHELAHLGERTTLADGALGRSDLSSLAALGRAFASPEADGAAALRGLGATHVLVSFGGYAGMPDDDMRRLPWMAKLGGMPPIDHLRIDEHGGAAVLNSTLYQLCYYRFDGLATEPGRRGFDRARRMTMAPRKVDTLDEFAEVFTSTNWLVRVYRLLPKRNDAEEAPEVVIH